MEGMKEKKKIKGILRKTWERCKSFGQLKTTLERAPSFSTQNSLPGPPMVKSKSWSSFSVQFHPSSTRMMDRRALGRSRSKKPRMDPVVPQGCFSVYVGPDKQRFVIKVECTGHPLFKMLLEEAELEYGFHSDGPLALPCDVDVFVKVLFEMDADHHPDDIGTPRCGFPRSSSLSYQPLSPCRSASTLVSLNQLV